MRGVFANNSSPSFKGIISYNQAKIKACLGQKEEAIALLTQAREKGFFSAFFRLSLNLELVNLRGYQPFEDLLGSEASLR